MFEVSCLILDLFLLVLGILFNFTPDTIHKSGGFSKTFPQEGFKFVLGHRDSVVAFNPSFVLLSAEEDFIFKKRGHKWYLSLDFCSNSFKIIFILSTEIITFHMQGSIVQVWVLSFMWPIWCIFSISRLYGCWEVLAVLYKCLHKLAEQVILRWWNKGCSGSRSESKSENRSGPKA